MSRMTFKMRLKTGDTVVVRSGKFKGRSGKIVAVHPKLNKVTVEGINVVKRAYKASPTRPTGGLQEITKPLWVSKVGLVEGTGKKPSRVSYKLGQKGEKSRILKSTGKEVK